MRSLGLQARSTPRHAPRRCSWFAQLFSRPHPPRRCAFPPPGQRGSGAGDVAGVNLGAVAQQWEERRRRGSSVHTTTQDEFSSGGYRASSAAAGGLAAAVAAVVDGRGAAPAARGDDGGMPPPLGSIAEGEVDAGGLPARAQPSDGPGDLRGSFRGASGDDSGGVEDGGRANGTGNDAPGSGGGTNSLHSLSVPPLYVGGSMGSGLCATSLSHDPLDLVSALTVAHDDFRFHADAAALLSPVYAPHGGDRPWPPHPEDDMFALGCIIVELYVSSVCHCALPLAHAVPWCVCADPLGWQLQCVPAV